MGHRWSSVGLEFDIVCYYHPLSASFPCHFFLPCLPIQCLGSFGLELVFCHCVGPLKFDGS